MATAAIAHPDRVGARFVQRRRLPAVRAQRSCGRPIYFARRLWRSATVYAASRARSAKRLADAQAEQRFIAIFVPAWDEAAVIAPMLEAALARIDYDNYRIFVGITATTR